MSDLSASSVVQAAKQQFARHGIPVWVHSDGGPQFAAREFSVFSQTWGFEHTLSSPYNSQSNGKAESAVKIAKKLWKRSRDPYLALLEWRNTPTIAMGSSPCQRMLARRTRGVVPMADYKRDPVIEPHVLEKKLKKQELQILRANQRVPQERTLPSLAIGQPVLAQDMRAFKTQWDRGTCGLRHPQPLLCSPPTLLPSEMACSLRASETYDFSAPTDHQCPQYRIDLTNGPHKVVVM